MDRLIRDQTCIRDGLGRDRIVMKISLYGLISMIFIISLLSLCAMNVEAASQAHEEDTTYTLLSLKQIANKTYFDKIFESKGWWYYNARRYNSVENIDFTKDFWMPIEPWEYEVCSRGLTTQLEYEGNAGIGSIFSGIYGDTVTVAAYKRVPERNVDVDPSKLYEVSWYFHPANEGRHYNIKLLNTVTGASKEIRARTEASKKTGSVGYYAYYLTADYNKVVLTDESTPQEFTFNIVETQDANR